MTRVLVTGGTGALGRELVPRLQRAGHTVRVMSRRARRPGDWPDVEWAQADVVSGEGLAGATSEAEVIVHAASSPFGRTQQVDVDGTRRVLEAARRSGAAHFIYVSIVGIERIPFPYYRHKVAAENVVMEARVPWSIQRATQFHTLLDGFLQSATRLPVALLPSDFQFQPLDAGECADRLVECAALPSSGRLPDIGGPEVLRLGALARVWLAARNLRRLILHLPLPGGFARALRQGHNTCPTQKYGRLTWAEWVRSTRA